MRMPGARPTTFGSFGGVAAPLGQPDFRYGQQAYAGGKALHLESHSHLCCLLLVFLQMLCPCLS